MTDPTSRPAYVDALASMSTIVDDLIADLDPVDWATRTPAPGWSVHDQVGHLVFIYRIADLAVRDPEEFSRVMSSAPSMGAAIDATVRQMRALTADELAGTWGRTRDRCVASFAAADPATPVPWLVRPLPPAVLAAAGMMETFAHCHDVTDALGTSMPDVPELAHVVQFAIAVRDFGYEAHGVEPPAEEFRFELRTVDDAFVTAGPAEAADRVTGSAYDFCRVVTRRRHHADTDVRAVGPNAPAWLDIAQAYRGDPGEGRRPGQHEDGARDERAA